MSPEERINRLDIAVKRIMGILNQNAEWIAVQIAINERLDAELKAAHERIEALTKRVDAVSQGLDGV